MNEHQLDIVSLGDIHTGDGTVSRHDALRLIGLVVRMSAYIDHTNSCHGFQRLIGSGCHCDYNSIAAMAENIIDELHGVPEEA